jgi:hypothetical protein
MIVFFEGYGRLEMLKTKDHDPDSFPGVAFPSHFDPVFFTSSLSD